MVSAGGGNLGSATLYLSADPRDLIANLAAARTATTNTLERIGRDARLAGFVMTAGLTVPILGLAGLAGKLAIDFESAFTGVEKTTEGTTAQFDKLRSQIIQMSKEVPTSAAGIAKIAEVAGQLGVSIENIEQVTRVAVDLGNATTLSAEDAATSLVRLMQVMNSAPGSIRKIADTLVTLGNQGASTEKEILDLSLRLAGAGRVIGVSENDVLGLANGLKSLGLPTEAAGSSMSRVFADISQAVTTGSTKLDAFAKIAGLTREEFFSLAKANPVDAVLAFIKGLEGLRASGGDVYGALKTVNLETIRIRQTLLGAASGYYTLYGSVKLANDATKTSGSAAEEAAKRYKTAASQLRIMLNRIQEVAIGFGGDLIPILLSVGTVVGSVINALGWLARGFGGLSEGMKSAIVVSALFLASIGPITGAIGSLITVMTVFKTFLSGFYRTQATAAKMNAAIAAGVNGTAAAVSTAKVAPATAVGQAQQAALPAFAANAQAKANLAATQLANAGKTVARAEAGVVTATKKFESAARIAKAAEDKALTARTFAATAPAIAAEAQAKAAAAAAKASTSGASIDYTRAAAAQARADRLARSAAGAPAQAAAAEARAQEARAAATTKATGVSSAQARVDYVRTQAAGRSAQAAEAQAKADIALAKAGGISTAAIGANTTAQNANVAAIQVGNRWRDVSTGRIISQTTATQLNTAAQQKAAAAQAATAAATKGATGAMISSSVATGLNVVSLALLVVGVLSAVFAWKQLKDSMAAAEKQALTQANITKLVETGDPKQIEKDLAANQALLANHNKEIQRIENERAGNTRKNSVAGQIQNALFVSAQGGTIHAIEKVGDVSGDLAAQEIVLRAKIAEVTRDIDIQKGALEILTAQAVAARIAMDGFTDSEEELAAAGKGGIGWVQGMASELGDLTAKALAARYAIVLLKREGMETAPRALNPDEDPAMWELAIPRDFASERQAELDAVDKELRDRAIKNLKEGTLARDLLINSGAQAYIDALDALDDKPTKGPVSETERAVDSFMDRRQSELATALFKDLPGLLGARAALETVQTSNLSNLDKMVLEQSILDHLWTSEAIPALQGMGLATEIFRDQLEQVAREAQAADSFLQKRKDRRTEATIQDLPGLKQIQDALADTANLDGTNLERLNEQFRLLDTYWTTIAIPALKEAGVEIKSATRETFEGVAQEILDGKAKVKDAAYGLSGFIAELAARRLATTGQLSTGVSINPNFTPSTKASGATQNIGTMVFNFERPAAEVAPVFAPEAQAIVKQSFEEALAAI